MVGALDYAQAFCVSLLVGILIAYALNPLVVHLERIRVPRAVGAAMVMAFLVGGLSFGAYALRGQAQAIIEQLPEATRTLSVELARLRADPEGNIKKVQDAAAVLEKAATQDSATAPAPRQRAAHVTVDPPGLKIGNFLMTGSLGAIGFAGQALTVLFLAFFLLLGGDLFRRKLARLTGSTLAARKITAQILDDIGRSVQKYLFMLAVTNALVGVLAWIALRWIGLENAGAWAAASAVLHLVPYIGPGFTAAALGMAAFMQFESFAMAMAVCGASLAIATVSGTLVATWMTGRIARMNAAAVFISLLFWGWIWGIWGLLLGIPIVGIFKVVAERVDALKPAAELLGE